MSEVVHPKSKERLKIYNEMPEALQKVADVIDTKLGAGAKGLVLIRFDVGQMIKDVIAKEAKYGAKAVEQLAAYRGERATTLYALRDFATTYEREFVAEWTSKPMEDGGFLETGHWLALRQIESEKQRQKMLEKTLKESWGVNQLETEIASGAAGRTRNQRSGGRRPSTPTSPLAGLQKFGSLVTSLRNYGETAEAAVFDVIDEMAAENVNDVYLERLETTLTDTASLIEQLTAEKDRLEKNRDRVKELLEEKAAAEEAATVSDESAEAGAAAEADPEGEQVPAEPKKRVVKKIVKKIVKKKPVAATA